ncbi:MAG: 50S ribosomal protein L31 [Mollicutes bacterium UO1]
MKKKIHLSNQQVIYHCISCESKYQTISTSSQDVRIESCINCNNFYTGASTSEIKVGAVEKFRQRTQKVKERS